MRLVCARSISPLLLAIALSLAGCGDGAGGSPSTQARALEGVFGTVVDTDGAPVAGATVRVGAASAATDAAGTFALEVAPGTGLVAAVRSADHLPVFLTVDVHAGAASRIDATLMPMADPITVDVTAGAEASGTRGSGVSIEAGSLVDASGAAVTGEVQVFLTPYDPTDEEELAAYPGALTAEQTGGEMVQLQSYGVLDVTILQDGAELDVADGATLTARIPVPAGVTDPPATVGLWSFDEERAIWIEEGTATLDQEAGVYVAELTHLSPWNADDPTATTCITGRAIDDEGEPIPGARIRVTGVSILAMNENTAGADGTFCAFGPLSSQVRVTVIHGDGGGVIQEIATGDTAIDQAGECGPSCTDMGDIAVTRGEVTVRDGDGGSSTVDCASVGNPLVGTCAAEMNTFFTCFRPSGECTLSGFGASGGTVEYGNGARMVMTSMSEESFTAEYYGPSGTLCGTSEAVDLEAGEIEFRTGDGDGPWRMVERGTDRALVCPNGHEVLISTAEFDAFAACTGGDGTEECTFSGGVAMCADDSDCAGGQTCCIVGDYAYCADAGDCSDMAVCTTDTDCGGGDQVCCEISGIRTCTDQATCDAAAGCTSDADCGGETPVCCDFGGFASCVPAGVCPS